MPAMRRALRFAVSAVHAARHVPQAWVEVRALRRSGRPARLLDVLTGWSARPRARPVAVGESAAELDRLGELVRQYLAPYADAPDLPTAVLRAQRDRRWQ